MIPVSVCLRRLMGKLQATHYFLWHTKNNERGELENSIKPAEIILKLPYNLTHNIHKSLIIYWTLVFFIFIHLSVVIFKNYTNLKIACTLRERERVRVVGGGGGLNLSSLFPSLPHSHSLSRLPWKKFERRIFSSSKNFTHGALIPSSLGRYGSHW